MKSIIVFSFIATIFFQGYSQAVPAKNYYDIKKLRLLITSTGMYIHNANQGAIDLDSTLILACRANNVPLSIAYDEGYNDGGELIGSKLIEKGNVDAAKSLLPKLQGIDKLKLLFQLGGFYLFKAGNTKKDLDNAYPFIQNARFLSDSLKIQKWQNQSWILLGKYYAQANDYPKSKSCLLKALYDSQKTRQDDLIVEAMDNLGKTLPLTDTTKVIVLASAMKLYKKLNQKEKEIEMLMEMLTIHFWEGKVDLTRKELYQSLALQKSIDFKHIQYTETTISYLELIRGNMNPGLVYALKSIKTMESTADTTFSEYFYLRLGDIYKNSDRFDEAIDVYKRCIDDGQSHKNRGIWYKGFMGRISCLSKSGRWKEGLNYILTITKDYPPDNLMDRVVVLAEKGLSYFNENDFVNAEKSYRELDLLLPKISSLETRRLVDNCYANIALFYASLGKGKLAKLYAEKVLKSPMADKEMETKRTIELAMFRIDSLSGNFISSIRHYQRYQDIIDSIYNITITKEISKLQVQYETVEKEQNIKLLKNESSLQQSELRRSKLLRNVTFGSILLLLMLIGLLYSRYLIKQRSNATLEIKQIEINQKNNTLQHLVTEKEWLLKEIHHRVKNNLQTVMSLLSSQSAYLKNDAALSAIQDSQHRVHVMSLLHQKLYMSEDASAIDMRIYIHELVEYLGDAFNTGQRIRFEMLVDSVKLDVVQAVPVGLILNEAITNSLKYAFPDNREGIIKISFLNYPENNYELKVADNGIGLPENFNRNKSGSLGMSLMIGLSEDLEGNFIIENDGGTSIKISFVHDVALNRIESVV
jgi:two-component system, sensor histidine kinase PdtaS